MNSELFNNFIVINDVGTATATPVKNAVIM
jgi:hypothetical protein